MITSVQANDAASGQPIPSGTDLAPTWLRGRVTFG